MSTKHKPRIKPPPEKKFDLAYRQIWRLVDGEVRSTFKHHPDYLPSPEFEHRVRNSINKRVVGKVLGWARERVRGRSHSDERP